MESRKTFAGRNLGTGVPFNGVGRRGPPAAREIGVSLAVPSQSPSDIQPDDVAGQPDDPPKLDRRAEVEARQEIIARWLQREGYEAVFLFDPDSFSWFTAGGSLGLVRQSARTTAFLFITARQRCLVSSNDVTDRLFAAEIDGLGFQSKQFHWSRAAEEIVAELRGGRVIPADQPGRGLIDRGADLSRLRWRLSPFDREHLRLLVAYLSHAVEATCRSIRPAETDWEITGHLAHRLLHHGLELVDARVLAENGLLPRPDGRGGTPIERAFSLLATARAFGLYATTSRSVAWGEPPQGFQASHRVATLVAGSLARFTTAGETAGEVLKKGLRIYQKFGNEFAWLDAPLGQLTGHSLTRYPFTPQSELTLDEGMAVSWTPMVGGVPSADVVLVRPEQPEVLIHCENWPTVGVELQGLVVPRPDILVR